MRLSTGVSVHSEHGRLRSAMLISTAPFHRALEKGLVMPEGADLRSLVKVRDAYALTLEAEGVAITWAQPPAERPWHSFARDVAAVVGDRLLLCSMGSPLRREEAALAAAALPEGAVQLTGVVEGGDLLVDGDRLYVGVGATDAAGVASLRETLEGRFEIIELGYDGERHAHLDLIVNLLGEVALVYPPALDPLALSRLAQRYELVEVTPVEQLGLGVNMIAVGPGRVIADARQRRLNSRLRACGIEVIELAAGPLAATGGLFRCLACPLWRDPVPATSGAGPG